MGIDINSPAIYIRRDDDNRLRKINQFNEPYIPSDELPNPTLSELAVAYVQDLRELLELSQQQIDELTVPSEIDLDRNFTELRKGEERVSENTVTHSFVQTYFGIPIWEKGIGAELCNEPRVARGITSNWSYDDINIPKPDGEVIEKYKNITDEELIELLRCDPPKVYIVESSEIIIFQYLPEKREDEHQKDCIFSSGQFSIDLPAVSPEIEANGYYLARKVLFSFPGTIDAAPYWRCFIDLNTGSVLQLTCSLACATGKVFMYDPITLTGASYVNIKGYHTKPSGGNIWPQDWQLMQAAPVVISTVLPGGVEIAGPIEWTPVVAGHESVLVTVSATGDTANSEIVTNVPDWYLVPNDNNIAQRNVVPVPAGNGSVGLPEDIARMQFFVRNPYQTEENLTLETELPPILKARGWELTFTEAGPEFVLPAFEREGILVKMEITPGESFTREDVLNTESRDIVISMVTGKGIIGGMTYRLDPDLDVYDETGED